MQLFLRQTSRDFIRHVSRDTVSVHPTNQPTHTHPPLHPILLRAQQSTRMTQPDSLGAEESGLKKAMQRPGVGNFLSYS